MAASDTIRDQLKGVVLLTCIAVAEDEQFVSYCRELGTTSCGDTVEEAIENLQDAIDVHIEALLETGELSRFLKERNVRIELDGDPPVDEPYLRVPLEKFLKVYAKEIPLAVSV